MPLHGVAPYFGFGAQSELVLAPVLMVAPLTLPPMAMPLQSAWTLADAGFPSLIGAGFSTLTDAGFPSLIGAGFSMLTDAGLETCASGGFGEGEKRGPKAAQSPVAAAIRPPPSHPRTC